jgi:hypothetical protein
MKQKSKDIVKGVVIGSSLTILGVYLIVRMFKLKLKKCPPAPLPIKIDPDPNNPSLST